jgi:hypothetical protein
LRRSRDLPASDRHCEPTGRANARPMTGSAKQSISPRKERMDCFVAIAPRKDGGTTPRDVTESTRDGYRCAPPILQKYWSQRALHPSCGPKSWEASGPTGFRSSLRAQAKQSNLTEERSMDCFRRDRSSERRRNDKARRCRWSHPFARRRRVRASLRSMQTQSRIGRHETRPDMAAACSRE